MDGASRQTEERAIRIELGTILDRLNAIPSEAIRERAELSARRDHLKSVLADLKGPGSKAIVDRWAERAASKPTVDEGKPVISSPGEGGQAGGG